MKTSNYHLGFIGFGHMAQILFKAMDLAKMIPRSQVSFIQRDPHKMKRNEQKFGITSTSLERLIEKSDLIILGVRPNQAGLVLENLKRLKMDENKQIISILAGVKLSYYKKFLNNPILRVMPNIASEVGMGMSVFTFSPKPSLEFRSIAHILFSSMGEVIEVPEEVMDISCALAGSGPAFVFRMMDAIAKVGVSKGLDPGNALKIAAQVFMGAGKLALKYGGTEKLLDQIATPFGTTEAGLKKFNELRIDEELQKVILESAKRSAELSEEFK